MEKFTSEKKARAWAKKFRADNWAYDASTNVYRIKRGEWVVYWSMYRSCD